jgi:2-C-methyl-D-erythritol 4-phosphate cytidylyltransferase/2-C-methyl-D-erythritol 2,4-cyclodiphosphate synthase
MDWKSVSTELRSPQLSSIKVALLVVAAGRGLRLGSERPKQYLNCAGRPLISHTLEALAAGWPFSTVAIAIRPDDRAL